jgi:hypothetical protein
MEEITPKHLRCEWGQCVSVYRMEDGKLLVIGKQPDAALTQEIQNKVGPDESAIVISPEFFADLQT